MRFALRPWWRWCSALLTMLFVLVACGQGDSPLTVRPLQVADGSATDSVPLIRTEQSVILIDAQASFGTAYGLQVDYSVRSQWQEGFVADVTIQNLGDPIDGWRLDWIFPSDQIQITNLWNGQLTQDGANVSVQNLGWNARIPSNGEITFGFEARYRGTDVIPSAFTLNGSTLGNPTPAPLPAACEVNYQIRTQWGQGFVADLQLRNLGSPVTNWELSWAFPVEGVQITNLWNGQLAQNGREVTVSNLDWNATIANQQQLDLGFQAAYPGGGVRPTEFYLNGLLCNGLPASPATPTPDGSGDSPAQILNAADIDGIPLTVGQSITLQGSSPAIEWRDSSGRVLGQGSQLVYQAQTVGMETITAQIGQVVQSRVSFTVSTPDIIIAPHVKVIPEEVPLTGDSLQDLAESRAANGILTLPVDDRVPTLQVGDVVVGARLAPQQITDLETRAGFLSLTTVPALPKQVIERAAVRFENVPLELSLATDPIPLVDIPPVAQTLQPLPRWEAFQTAGDPTPVGIQATARHQLDWQSTFSGSLNFEASVGEGLSQLILIQQAQIQTELEVQASGFYRWQQDPQDQVMIAPQVRTLVVNVGPVPIPIELAFGSSLAYEANLWLNGQAGIQVGLASAALRESVVYEPGQSQPWQRQAQLPSSQWQGSVSPESNISGVLTLVVHPQMEVGIFGSSSSGGLGITGVLVGGSSDIEITQDSSSPGQLQGQVSGQSRSVLVGQAGYIATTEGTADVARFTGGLPDVPAPEPVNIPTSFGLVGAVLVTGFAVKGVVGVVGGVTLGALLPALIPAAVLTAVGVGVFITLNQASQPDLSGLRLGDPIPLEINVSLEQVQQTIDDLTGGVQDQPGGEEDEDPQPGVGDSGGQCTPPPSPPPVDLCEGNQPVEPSEINEEGFSKIERHLDDIIDQIVQRDGISRKMALDCQRGERAMLDRLRAGRRTSFDIEFYYHEVLETDYFVCFDVLNQPEQEYNSAFDRAHNAALDRRGVSEQSLFHPEVVSEFPTSFDPGWLCIATRE